ncbi:UNVERIFIED_CONTAM: hypothetical protein RF648_05355 [Kocuria sp. CPCC 205274]
MLGPASPPPSGSRCIIVGRTAVLGVVGTAVAPEATATRPHALAVLPARLHP